MDTIKTWITDEVKFRLVRIVISGISLALSLIGIMLPFGIDSAWIAIVFCGIPIVKGACEALITEHDIKADVLVSLALIGSLIAKEFFAAGEVAFIMEIGSALEDYTSERARKGIEKLIGMVPKTARVRRNGTESVIASDDIVKGDTVIVLAGETVPADGIITKGSPSIDQSAMTGESMPCELEEGDEVMSGTVNLAGVFEFTATSEPENSSLERMIRLAEEADENKAPIVSLADKWATWLVLAAFAAALITFGVNWFIAGTLRGAFLRCVTVLIVVCPCAFILATPTAVMAGIGNAAKRGLILRSGDSLQRFAYADTVCLDKTGTLTEGTPEVKECISLGKGLDEKEILRYAAALERYSEHPVGRSIASCAGDVPPAENFSVVPGKGVSGKVEGHEVYAGTRRYFAENGICLPGDGNAPEGISVVYVAVDAMTVGIIVLADRLREKAPQTVERLRDMNVRTVILTGDGESPAKAVAEACRTEYVSGLLPSDKQAMVRKYREEGRNVLMAGDGINDAPALRSADCSVAMGGIGSDIAIESADAVLVGDDIDRIPYLISLSRAVMKKIRTNIILSLVINTAAVILASSGILTPVTGALFHNAGSVFVVVNSITLLGYGKKA